MTVEIFCPLYNAEKYIDSLHESIFKQEKVDLIQIHYSITESNDATLAKVKKLNHCVYEVIKKKDFSHSKIREMAAIKTKADIIVFITQDVEIRDSLWLSKLINKIEKNECAASYSRQITKYNNLEKYTREMNYPSKSFFTSKSDIQKMGLKTFFFSDVASAINVSIFKKLRFYDGKNLPTSEDMYIAYKLIMNQYVIYYAAESVVYHSHNFTLKEIYNRYKLIGQFFKENEYLDQYGTNKSGGGLAKYILKRSLQDFNIRALFRFPFDMAARLFGMRVGKHNK